MKHGRLAEQDISAMPRRHLVRTDAETQKTTDPSIRLRPLKLRFLPAILGILCLVTLPSEPLEASTPVHSATMQEAAEQQADDAAAARNGPAEAGRQGPMNLEELSSLATAAVVRVEVEAGKRSRQGSGFIVDPEGLIVTNHHVIRDATNATVRLSSGDIYDRVSVLAVDERRDLAVLKISGFGLPTLRLGNSDSVRIGTEVIAIGSPLGLENTVSTGIVSGRRTEPKGFQLLQITAPASTGSSGGPVLLRDGRVVGIAASQFRNGQNLNFAVPVNYARGLLAGLGGEPMAVLGATSLAASTDPAEAETEMAATEDGVNRGLQFDLSRFEDHRLDLTVHEPGEAVRRTRVTYRRIEDIAGGEPRIERYVEGESSLEREGQTPPRTVRRERRRSLMSAVDLAPVSARGEIEWLSDGVWHRTTYDILFAEGRVVGTVEDSAGVVRQIDREVPPGLVLRDMRDIAFGALVAEPLVGRSMELRTFDATSGEVKVDRFDIRRRTTIAIGGEQTGALAVDVASGLVNERAYFSTDVPRRLLRREDAETGAVEEVVAYYVLPAPDENEAP
jgi:S1-C subfamily serine protease